ncbi:unnamed protein product [Urochloa humidicola]
MLLNPSTPRVVQRFASASMLTPMCSPTFEGYTGRRGINTFSDAAASSGLHQSSSRFGECSSEDFFPEALQRTPSLACGDIVPTVIGTCRVIGAPVAVQSRSAWYRALWCIPFIAPGYSISLECRMSHTLLSALRLNDHYATVCVRVTRRWEYKGASDDGPIQHVDLVLADRQANTIYAEIPQQVLNQFQDQIEEGHAYQLSCFRVANAKSVYKPI